MGDGEMDEPESLGAITLAARESLDNLVFVINCNLQRLDGPVRGNGKIIQELEAAFEAPAGTSSKSFGVPTGIRCFSATPRVCSKNAWKRLSTANTRTSRRRAVPIPESTSLDAIQSFATWCPIFPTTISGDSIEADTTLTKCIPHTPRRLRTRTAHRNPR